MAILHELERSVPLTFVKPGDDILERTGIKEKLLEAGDLQVRNHPEIRTPIPQISSVVKEIGERVERVIQRKKEIISKLERTYTKATFQAIIEEGDLPIEADLGPWRPILPGERSLIIHPKHITKGKDGQRLVPTVIYGGTNLAEL